MVPIKSNHHPNRYAPLDHAEMKSQPFKLIKNNRSNGGLGRLLVVFMLVVLLQNFLPMISTSQQVFSDPLSPNKFLQICVS
ncbi:hypothetical protein Hanom_Chr01g00007671 [Helianthus anomalus]